MIAYNEAEKIGPAIKSVAWADEIVVADSYSQDATADIATSLGARVVQIPFKGFGDLRNRAMAACTHEWIFSLDSDERCTSEVQREILEIVRLPGALDAYYIPRKNFFMGKWIKHSGFFPDYRQPQLFRKGVIEFNLDPVHEAYIVHSGKGTGYLKNAISQIPYKDFEELLHKANRYSTLGAQKLEEKGKKGSMAAALLHGAWAFIHLFFLKQGYVDGWPGFVIALGNFEGTFYKYAKLAEKQRGWKYNRHTMGG
ncbi:MAG: glycosyltransferase family 2 protein [Deltaproteobacteria bacterium]|nr:glycosyltransferase family 2 protein [Deltaproteobacteria bacterium]